MIDCYFHRKFKPSFTVAAACAALWMIGTVTVITLSTENYIFSSQKVTSSNRRLRQTHLSNYSQVGTKTIPPTYREFGADKENHFKQITSSPSVPEISERDQKPILKTDIRNVTRTHSPQSPLPSSLLQLVTVLTSNISAPGELGWGVELDPTQLSTKQRLEYDEGLKSTSYNEYASNMISTRRRLPDYRDQGCKAKNYSTDLPNTSVIIIFHNEALSVLLRSVYSVIDRSDPNLLKEIILVDDFSNKVALGELLEKYIQDLKIVKLVRLKKREGLIRAKLAGAEAARGQVLTFLDSHIECTEGWLEPLLHEVHLDRKTLAIPSVDVIHHSTFAFRHVLPANMFVGGFDWGMNFLWMFVSKRENARRKNNVLAPVQSPVMVGGLFSVDREYFYELGSYDEGMELWGGENLEMSFRCWMCGGRVLTIPCSAVGHLEKPGHPYISNEGFLTVFKRNSIRVAEVWLDDYKKYFYDTINNNLGDYGNVSARVELRKKLKCNSFEWYLKNIYPERFVPDDALYGGKVRNGAVSACLQWNPYDESQPITLDVCNGEKGGQNWLMSELGEIRQSEDCMEWDNSKGLIMIFCHGAQGSQKWEHRGNGLLVYSVTNECLEATPTGYAVTMSPCNATNSHQIWDWKKRN